jgi:hypothetical protein
LTGPKGRSDERVGSVVAVPLPRNHAERRPVRATPVAQR